MSRRVGLLGGGFGVNGFTYDGEFNFTKDGANWRLELLSSGTLKFNKNLSYDAFIVGGGGGGGYSIGDSSGGAGAGGGGGGYCLTITSEAVAGNEVQVTIGAGGAGGIASSQTSATAGGATIFGEYSADGGLAGGYSRAGQGGGNGGRGGSGGGGGSGYQRTSSSGGSAGADGSNGTEGSGTRGGKGNGGLGQMSSSNSTAIKNKYGRINTREFFAIDGDATAPAHGKGGDGGSGRQNAMVLLLLLSATAVVAVLRKPVQEEAVAATVLTES